MLSLLSTVGCAVSSQPSSQVDQRVLVTPRQASLEQQAAIAKISEMITLTDPQSEQLPKLYYERGVRYDTLGLKALAHLDFNRALRLKPDFADAYNFLGIHYTLGEQYIEAFEAFGSALELKPDHNFALLNRGIARYYAGRDSLAMEDLNEFFLLQPQDPYRALWLYLAESRVNPELAMDRLRLNRLGLSNQEWGTFIVDFYLGKISIDELLISTSYGLSSDSAYSERLCEAYFYIAKRELTLGANHAATQHFKLAIATNIHDFVEHRYALLELKRIAIEESGY